MRLLRLFLVISLFMQPICSAQQEITQEHSVMSQTKDAAYKLIQWGKNSVRTLVSPAGQLGLIALYGTPYLYEIFKMNNGSMRSVTLSELPLVIQDAIRDMNLQKHIDFKVAEDFICYAQHNTVVLPEKLSFSPEIQRYIAGHEMAHIELHHTSTRGPIMVMALIAAVWFSIVGLEVICNKYAKYKNDQTYTGKTLIATQKIVDYIMNNPIVFFAIAMTIGSRWSQYIEQEADLEAINRLKCAQGAVEWVRYRIESVNKATENASWLSLFSPLAISNHISTAFEWTRHGSLSKGSRISIVLSSTASRSSSGMTIMRNFHQ